MNSKILPYRFLLFAASVLALALMSSCKSQKSVYSSSWIDNPERLNKVAAENVEHMHYNPDAKMFYNIFNDSERLYVMMLVNDKVVQKKIMMAGLTFWMDTIPKKKKIYKIIFPLPGSLKNSMDEINRDQMRQQMRNSGTGSKMTYQQLNERLAGSLEEMEVVGFDHIESPEIIRQDSAGILATMKFDEQGSLHYKLSVPLHYIFSNPEDYLNNPDKVFTCGFETGFFDMPMAGGGGRPGGMRGGMAGGMGGGMPGGGMGGMRGRGGSSAGMAGMQEMSKESKFRVKEVHLSNE